MTAKTQYVCYLHFYEKGFEAADLYEILLKSDFSYHLIIVNKDVASYLIPLLFTSTKQL